MKKNPAEIAGTRYKDEKLMSRVQKTDGTSRCFAQMKKLKENPYIIKMSFIFISILLVFLYYTLKRPELGLVFTMALIGFGPLFDTFVGNGVKFAAILAIFLIETFRAGRMKYFNKMLIIYIIIAFFKELLSLIAGSTLDSFVNAIFVYIILISITFFSFIENKRKGKDFYNQFKYFIFVCLVIQFYRIVFDYSFFGMAMSTQKMDMYSDIYEYGSFSFRPSSLEDAIIFSIELSVFMCWMMFREGINKKNILYFIVCLIGLLFTFSRSGLVVLIIGLIWYMYKSKKSIGSLLVIISIGIFLMMAMDYTDRFLDIFSSKSETSNYDIRFNSMKTVIGQIEEFSIPDIILGKGYNVANAPQKNGEILYYVENYYLTLLINSGIFALLLFILYFIRVVFVGLKKHNNFFMLCFLILLVNTIAASLYANNILMLLFYFSFAILYNVRIENNELRINGVRQAQ